MENCDIEQPWTAEESPYLEDEENMEQLPNRASDAGPEQGPPPTWSDLSDYAIDWIRDAQGAFDDNPTRERRKRIAALLQAKEYVQNALLAIASTVFDLQDAEELRRIYKEAGCTPEEIKVAMAVQHG